jgi:signal transduction histidine kinase
VSAPKDLVLYVDDERANRIVFEQSFGGRYNVKVLPSAQEALELLKSEAAAVLITDQRMPEMSGHELLVRVKHLYPDIVRVVITAYSDLDPILAAVNEGLVARYIIKPWDRQELEQLLNWSLEAYRMGRESSELQLRLMQTERLVTLGSIAASVLHDLHQPLTNLTVNLDRLTEVGAIADKLPAMASSAGASKKDRHAVDELAAELPELVKDLLASCKVMRDLTASMRQFLQSEPARAAAAAVDAIPIIQYALSVCRETGVRARARLVYDGPTELPKVRMGATELTQVMINVVANGAQALLDRGRPGGRLVVTASEQGARVLFNVTDNGPGMAPELLKKVGTPFFSTRREGTGLGVAQCRRLIGAAGGEFDIQSTEKQGTTVTFSIPKG